ncbi:hypothetical protein NDU88_003973 [Pleurodeles waltl]|uniref:ribonuclease H n=1 Tax=Pleurodeles waltl TaxID=8319 RepID=A0AAV7VHF0_PLEWA|nr:hypothetical protein NDU88_003973 [Pleurodeles waltl]
MPVVLRTLLRSKKWAVTLLDSAAEVTICRQSLKDHLDVTATSDYIAVETGDGRVLPPDRVYDLTIQIEGEVERIISVIFWDEFTSDILLAERDWPPEHVCKLPHGSTPHPQPQYPVKHEAKALVMEILSQLEYQGVIEPCTSAMNNPLFPFAKPDHSYRIVVDYRHLNSHTRTYAIQNSHSTTLINNIVRKKYKTTLDISNGFFCQNLADESRDLSAFSFGSQKRFCRLPQGYKNSPGLFSARVTSILHELDSDALSYVADIYLTDDALDIHLARVDRIILGFADLGYKCNFKKSKIAFLSVLFLGYELSNEGKSLAPHFLEKWAQLKPPNTLKKLQSLLGFFNFGRTYIPDYAERIKPLYDLIQPNLSSRRWTIGHTHILRDIQRDKLEARHLYTRDNRTNLVIRIIAGALGFTYVTFNEGDTVPIAYKSHLYSNAEKRFALTEKILTAVQMAVIKERPLAQGKRIIVVSPVPALEAVTKASVPNAKALHPRWIQWATSLTATDVDYVFDPRLQTQEFLQYEQEYPAPLHILPIDSYTTIIYTDELAQPAVGTKHQYSAACAAVCGIMEDGVFHPHNTYIQGTAQPSWPSLRLFF